MMKKIKAITLNFIIVISILFNGCANLSDNNNYVSKDRSGIKYSIYEVSENHKNNFSDGYLYITFTDMNNRPDDTTYWQNYIGCANKNGDIQYYIKKSQNEYYYYKNGKMQIVGSTTMGLEVDYWISLDENGDILTAIKSGENEIDGNTYNINLYGGDQYILAEINEIGFNNSNEYLYRIIDANGNLLKEIKSDSKLSAYQCDVGIFNINGHIYYANDNLNIYNISGKVFSHDGKQIIDNPIDSSTSIMDGYTPTSEISIILETEKYIIYSLEHERNYKLYNIENSEIYNYDLSYNDFELFGNDNYITALIKGDDDYLYYQLYDLKGNIIENAKKIPETKNIRPYDVKSTFVDDIVYLNFYSTSAGKCVFQYDMSNKKEILINIDKEINKNNEYCVLTSDYVDGWAACLRYSKENNITPLWNYVNKSGEYLFDEDEKLGTIAYFDDKKLLFSQK